jgi:hypothetical protein
MISVGKAAVNATCQFKQTPLHWAAANDHGAICKLLLEAGAHVDACAVDGSTPLHFAARDSCPAAVTELLVAGANPAAKNSAGLRPIQMLWDDDEDVDIVNMLVVAGGGYPEPGPVISSGKPPLPAGGRVGGKASDSAPGVLVSKSGVTIVRDGGTGPRVNEAELPARVDAATGAVERLVHATVVVRQGPGAGGEPVAPSLDEVRDGLRCMAVGTDTDFPRDGHGGEDDVAVVREVVEVVFDGPKPREVATAVGGIQTISM